MVECVFDEYSIPYIRTQFLGSIQLCVCITYSEISFSIQIAFAEFKKDEPITKTQKHRPKHYRTMWSK